MDWEATMLLTAGAIAAGGVLHLFLRQANSRGRNIPIHVGRVEEIGNL